MFSYFVYVLYLTFFKQSRKAFLFQQPLFPLITKFNYVYLFHYFYS